MKKFIAVITTLVLVVSATVVFAASSPTYGNSKGTTTVHEVVKPGTATAAPTEAPAPTAAAATEAPAETTSPIIVIRPSSTPMPVVDNEIVVVEVGEEGNGEYTDPTGKLNDVNNSGYTEYGTYDVTTDSEEYKDVLKQEGTKISVTIDADLHGDIPFVVLVNYGDEWVELATENITVNGDGTVTLLLDGLCEIKFLVDKQATPIPTVAPVPTGAPVPTDAPVVETAAPAAEETAAPTVDTTAAPDKPSKEADYTVDKKVDYTVVSPQTGYLESWEVACNVPAALK